MTSGLQAYIERSGSWVALDRLPLGNYNPLTFGYGTYGTYKPGPTTSGIPAGSPPLEVITGTSGVFIITTPNAVYDLKDFQCEVQVRTTGVVISRSKVRGNTTNNNNHALVYLNNLAPYGSKMCVSLYDCELYPLLPSIWWNGIGNHNYEIHRSNIHGVVDPWNAFGSGTNAANVKIFGNYTHDQSMFSPDVNHPTSTTPGHPDYPVGHTHNDCGQWQGGANLTILGNNFEGYNDPTIGEATYTGASPNPSGGGPNNPAAGTGWYVNAPALQINGAGIQISNTVGGNCAGLDMGRNWWSGTNRIVTLSQSYPNLGRIIDQIVKHDHLATPAMNIPTGMDTGASPSLVLANNLYEDGTPVIVFHT